MKQKARDEAKTDDQGKSNPKLLELVIVVGRTKKTLAGTAGMGHKLHKNQAFSP